MTEEDIAALEHPVNYKKRESSMNAWLNIIYKMMVDGCSNELIYFYIKHQESFQDTDSKLAKYIYLIGKNNFPDRDPVIEKYIQQIKRIYPVVKKVENMFKEFHSLLMGKEESKLDEYLKKYEKSEIQAFCNGIKKDIIPVKNAISFSISSGFVEGNNNKFKVLKRIVYGRSGLVNLEKKCKLAFMSKSEDFSLSDLL